jgi:ABC-type cobalamin/Fe3+-siderophores transport system ATPase subunit
MRLAEIPDRYFEVKAGSVPSECLVFLWIALALLRNHKVLLVEDPVLHTSVAATEHVARVLRELAREEITILATTSDLRFAEMVGDRLLWFEDGRIDASSPVSSELVVGSRM